MSVFAYNPEAAKSWSSSIIEFLNGGSDSVGACSKKFSEQIEKLVQPNVWTGAAAAKNYQNFLETHQSLIKFINDFGNAYQEAMNEVNKSIASLEMANLGADTNVASTFGTLTYDQLTALSEENINKDTVRYDYATISGIGSELKNILTTLEDVRTKLTSKIDDLDNGSGMWDGTGASHCKESLTTILKNGMEKIFENLNVCISNISVAAQEAQNLDSRL